MVIYKITNIYIQTLAGVNIKEYIIMLLYTYAQILKFSNIII